MEDVPYYKNLLLIGGSGRNVGKTTLAKEIIRTFSLRAEIIGLKVSTHRKGEELYHGSHPVVPADNYFIKIEKQDIPGKDTAKMLRAGATSAYYIEAAGAKVNTAFQEFCEMYNPHNHLVICESRSLRKYIKPGLYILLLDDNGNKTITEEEKKQADIVYHVNFNDNNFRNLIETISVKDNAWTLNSIPPQQQDAVL